MPTADRQAERRALLLDAAFDLLGTEGWSRTTVRGVCESARLNPRYFYESFADLDELVVAVYDRVVEEMSEEVLDALQSTPADDPVAQFRAVVARIVAFVDEDRRRARVLYVEALGNEALNLRRIETGRAVVAFVERSAAERTGEPRSRRATGRVSAAILVGGFSELLTEWLAGHIPISRQRLIDDATALFLAMGEAAANLPATRRR